MKSLGPLFAILATIPDPRRAEGKLYQLPHVLPFSIFAIVSGAKTAAAAASQLWRIETPRITREMPRSVKMHRESERILAFSPGCAASLAIS